MISFLIGILDPEALCQHQTVAAGSDGEIREPHRRDECVLSVSSHQRLNFMVFVLLGHRVANIFGLKLMISSVFCECLVS